MDNRRVAYGEVIAPDDRRMVNDVIQRALEDQRSFELVYRIIAADGEVKSVWEQGRGILGADGELRGIEGYIAEITKRVRAETASRASEARFRGALENIPDVIVIYDRDLRIQYINAATRRITGQPVSFFPGTAG